MPSLLPLPVLVSTAGGQERLRLGEHNFPVAGTYIPVPLLITGIRGEGYEGQRATAGPQVWLGAGDRDRAGAARRRYRLRDRQSGAQPPRTGCRGDAPRYFRRRPGG